VQDVVATASSILVLAAARAAHAAAHAAENVIARDAAQAAIAANVVPYVAVEHLKRPPC